MTPAALHVPQAASIVMAAKLVLLVLAACALALFTGLWAAVVPWQFTVVLGFVPAVLAAALLSPLAGVIVVFALAAGVLPIAYLPRLPLVGGTVAPADLALALMASAVALRHPRQLAWAFRAVARNAWPVLLIVAVAIAAALRARTLPEALPKGILSDLRILLYWLAVPIVAATLVAPRAIERLLLAVLVIGTWLALAIVLSSTTGVKLFEGGQFTELQTAGVAELGILRAQPLGMCTVVFSLFLVAAWSASRRLSPLPAAACAAVLLLGLVLNFGRAYWAATVVGLLIVAATTKFRGFGRLAAMLVAICVPGLVALAAIKPELGRAALTRAVSVKDELAGGWSARWRELEGRYAVQSLRAQPLLGVGAGVPYRPQLSAREPVELRRYIHNSFLGLWLRLGIAGPLAAGAIVFTAILLAARVLTRARDPDDRATAGAALAGFLVPAVLVAWTQPEWMSSASVFLMATLIAVLLVLRARAFQELPAPARTAARARAEAGAR